MKQILITLTILLFLPAGALATLVTIPDSNTDRYGGEVFDVFSITVDTDPTIPMAFNIATNYPQTGSTVPGQYYNWTTYPADLILDVEMNGRWDYAIPLINHQTSGGQEFEAGHVYRVDRMWQSSVFKPYGDFSYNDAPVWLREGTDTGLRGTWTWENVPGSNPDYNIVYSLANWEWNDLTDGDLQIYWATATCGNDTIRGTVSPNAVPEPATMLLLGFGLIGLAGFGRESLFKNG